MSQDPLGSEARVGATRDHTTPDEGNRRIGDRAPEATHPLRLAAESPEDYDRPTEGAAAVLLHPGHCLHTIPRLVMGRAQLTGSTTLLPSPPRVVAVVYVNEPVARLLSNGDLRIGSTFSLLGFENDGRAPHILAIGDIRPPSTYTLSLKPCDQNGTLDQDLILHKLIWQLVLVPLLRGSTSTTPQLRMG